MAKAFEQWNVLPHGPLHRLTENLWSVQGSLPDMPIERRMVVARRNDGRLLIHNAIALDEPSMRAIDEWGPVGYLVVPNGWHRLDSASYKSRYPDAQVLCPAGARKRVEQVVPVDGTYDDYDADAAVSLEHLQGIRQAEGLLRVRSEQGETLVLNDLLFNLSHQRGMFGLIYRLLGSTGGPKITFVMRLLVVRDKAALRDNLEQLAGEPDLCRLIPGHGAIIDHEAPETLRTIAARL